MHGEIKFTFLLTHFFNKEHFYKNARLKLAKAKLHPDAELLRKISKERSG